MSSRTGDQQWLSEAIALSRQCPPADNRYSVGAIIVAFDGTPLSQGFSRENDDPHLHAEESALAKLSRDTDLSTATIYTSLEPCSARRSRQRTCTQLILDSGIRRVVFALREPPFLADCEGAELLQAAGLEVVEIPELAAAVVQVNARIFALPPKERPQWQH
jgi:pyrimidine deaminase RibD-like protein